MIKQPAYGTRNVNNSFYEFEQRQIALLNEVLGDVKLTKEEERTLIWLCGWEESTVPHIVSTFRKAMDLTIKRLEQPSDCRED